MNEQPPTFGPTDVIPCDENSEAFAVVRVAITVSLDQLRAALAIGHAQRAGEPPLAEMAVLDIRREVEGHLAAGAVIELHRETEPIVERVAASGILPALDAAINRAYGPREPAPMPEPVYGNGTVTLTTTDQGRVTLDEPTWCVGHDDQAVSHRSDTTHRGPWEAAEFMGVEFLPAGISWAPALEPVPVADVWEFPSMDPGQLRDLAAAVGAQAGRLYRLANELARLRGDHR